MAKRKYGQANRIRRYSSVGVLLGYGAKDPSWNIPFKINIFFKGVREKITMLSLQGAVADLVILQGREA